MENFISNNVDHEPDDFGHEQQVAPFWLPLADQKLFCTFETIYDANTGKYLKHPYGSDGKKGISVKDASRLDTASNVDELLQTKPDTWKLGLGFLHPIEVDGKYLVCIDVDIDADANEEAIARTGQIKKALLKTGAYFEQSVSGRGCHFFLLCDENNIPPTYNSNSGWKIEVFSGFKGQSKLLCLTGDAAQGQLTEVNLSLLFGQQGIGPVKEPTVSKATTININASLYANAADMGSSGCSKAELNEVIKALPYIPAEDYDVWLRVGIKIGSLFKLAMDNGFKHLRLKQDAADVFGTSYTADEDGVLEIPAKRLALRTAYNPHKLTLPSWAIDGVIPGGIGVIAGSPGVGKTTAVVPLGLCVAGFSPFQTKIRVKRKRKVVIFTEDPEQIHRLFYGALYWNKIGPNADAIDPADFDEKVIVIHSRRNSVADMRLDLLEVIDQYSIEDPVFGLLAPLVILDTAASNFQIGNENDNSEVSASLAMLKELSVKHSLLIWIIAHLAKTAKGSSIDEVFNMTARGAGSWEGDANWAATLARANPEDRNSPAVLAIGKERVGLLGTEIHFKTTIHQEGIIDVDQEEEFVKYPVVDIQTSSVQARQADKFHDLCLSKLPEIAEGIQEELSKADRSDQHLSKGEIRKLISVNTNDKTKVLDYLLNIGQLIEYEIPENERGNNQRKVGYRLANDATK